MSDEIIEFEILNFEQFFKRTRAKRTYWFAVPYEVLGGAKYQELGTTETLTWLVLVQIAAEQGQSKARASLKQVMTMTRARHDRVTSAARRLEEFQLVKVTKWPPTEQNRTEQNITGQHGKQLIARKNAKPASPQPPSATGKDTNLFIACYCELFKQAHGVNPQIIGKDAGIVKRVVREMSLARFEDLMRAYFSMPDPYLFKAKHPLNLFEQRLNEITVFAETGDYTTRRQANQADDSTSNMVLLEKVRRGEI